MIMVPAAVRCGVPGPARAAFETKNKAGLAAKQLQAHASGICCQLYTCADRCMGYVGPVRPVPHNSPFTPGKFTLLLLPAAERRPRSATRFAARSPCSLGPRTASKPADHGFLPLLLLLLLPAAACCCWGRGGRPRSATVLLPAALARSARARPLNPPIMACCCCCCCCCCWGGAGGRGLGGSTVGGLGPGTTDQPCQAAAAALLAGPAPKQAQPHSWKPLVWGGTTGIGAALAQECLAV